MGNFSSCFCSATSGSSRSAKLLDPHGNLQELDLPVRAAELMLEYPGHLVSPLERTLQAGKFIPLRADDELVAGMAYLMAPCNRVNGSATQEELELIGSALEGMRALETGPGIFRDAVLGVGLEEDGKKVGDGPFGEGVSGRHQQQQQQQLSCYRSHRPWSPALEPILEM